MGKFIFFDVDGTLLPFGKKMSQSTLTALRKAKESGHKILLATGRAPAEIDTSQFDIEFDGGVYAAGAYLEYEGRCLYKSFFNVNEVASMFSYAKDNNIDLLLQTPEGSYLTSSFKKTLRNLFISSFGHPLAIANLREENVLRQRPDITKFIIHSHNKTVTQISEELSKSFKVLDNTMGVPKDFTAEVMQKGITKATGIACFERLLHLDHSQIIAMGDGVNDKEMVAYASVGVAMGNGDDEVKKVADYITTSVENDGVYNALKYYKVI